MVLKKKVLLLLLLFVSFSSFAECGSNGLNVWPKKSKISKNPIFILETFSYSQGIVVNLNTKNKIYLKSINSKVPLIVVKINKGGFDLTQVILKPKTILLSNIRYELVIEGLDDYDLQSLKENNLEFITSNIRDMKSPAWVKNPVFIKNIHEEFGCGPDMFSQFRVDAIDDYNTAYITRLKEKGTKNVKEYVLFSNDNIINVGRSMCSGEFLLDNNKDYEITFLLIDSSGNTNKLASKTIQFNYNTRRDDLNEKTENLISLINTIDFKFWLTISVLLLVAFFSFKLLKK